MQKCIPRWHITDTNKYLGYITLMLMRKNRLYICVVNLEPYWYINHFKYGCHKVKNIGDGVFSNLYVFFQESLKNPFSGFKQEDFRVFVNEVAIYCHGGEIQCLSYFLCDTHQSTLKLSVNL